MMWLYDREVLSWGSFVVTWYGLLYLVAVVVGIIVLRRHPIIRTWWLSREQWLDVILASLVGILVGGRLGYVVWYEPQYYWGLPLEIVNIGNGGMSIHGGIVGVALALWVVARRYQLPLWQLYDAYVIPAAIGIGIGRLGNIINNEIFVGDAAKFIGVTGNFIIAGLCWRLAHARVRPGVVTGWWLVLYGCFRFAMEFVREPQWLVGMGFITRGHLLAVATMMVGIFVLRRHRFFSES